MFLLPRRIPNGGVLEGLCCERDEHGFLRTSPVGRISRPASGPSGTWLIHRAQAITAARMGATCAAALNHELVEEVTERDLPAHRPATGRPLQGADTGSLTSRFHEVSAPTGDHESGKYL